MNRKLPLWVTLLIVWTFCVITVLFGWAVWNIDSGQKNFGNKTDKIVLLVAKFPNLVSQSFHQLKGNNDLTIATNKYRGMDGMKLNAENYVDSNYLLLSSYDKYNKQSTVRLVRLSDQKIIHDWIPKTSEVLHYIKKDDPKQIKHDERNFKIAHPLLAADGSVYFNYVFSPLVKMNSDSHILWSLDGLFHHSMEFDADGNIWTACLFRRSKFDSGIFRNCRDDRLMKISPQGKVLFEKSVIEILLENGYRGLLWGVGTYEADVLHLNDVQPALTSTKYWLKGDLLVSLRNKSTVFLYRPSTNKILWLKTGPWLNQHDVDFIDSTRIGAFGNDVVRLSHRQRKLIEGINEQYVYDFSIDSVLTPYTTFLKNAQVATMTDGRSDVLSNGDLFVEETRGGRLLRGNESNTTWEFVQRINDNTISGLFWSRFVTADEFNELTFLNKKY